MPEQLCSHNSNLRQLANGLCAMLMMIYFQQFPNVSLINANPCHSDTHTHSPHIYYYSCWPCAVDGGRRCVEQWFSVYLIIPFNFQTTSFRCRFAKGMRQTKPYIYIRIHLTFYCWRSGFVAYWISGVREWVGSAATTTGRCAWCCVLCRVKQQKECGNIIIRVLA